MFRSLLLTGLDSLGLIARREDADRLMPEPPIPADNYEALPRLLDRIPPALWCGHMDSVFAAMEHFARAEEDDRIRDRSEALGQHIGHRGVYVRPTIQGDPGLRRAELARARGSLIREVSRAQSAE